ncbi:MAG: aminopeptidase P family protein [Nocardioidaceae bacterium]|nr:aminopeptidase P family protein [Nocardioidaceae bacterium]
MSVQTVEENRGADWFPTLTLAERDRRYARLRALMDEQGLDGLLVSGGGRDQLDRYVTNEGTRGYALLPREGEPVSMIRSGNTALGRYDVVGEGFERWVADERLVTREAPLSSVLAEKGLATGRVGVVGLSSRAPASMAGTIPYNTWARILADLPGATFLDVAGDFEKVMVVHSAEELDMIRKSAQIGERACAAMIAAAGVGVRESELVATGMREIFAGGGMTFPGPERCGPERLGWSGADWLWMGGGSRVMEKGDTFGAELFTFYGGFESQQQIDIALGELDEDHRFLDEVAVASYRAGLAALRPGLTFAELCEVMEAPLREADCWNMGPVVQTVSPVIFNSATHVGLDSQPGLAGIPHPPTTPRDGDFVIEPGVAFAFEPNACRDKKRVCVGGTVIVTEDGCEELNTLSNAMNVVPA